MLPDRVELVEAAMLLCDMLKQHHITKAPLDLRLFKARRLGDNALRKAIRSVDRWSIL